jgi:hypothetical protein
MKKPSYYHKKILSKRLDGCWDWEILIWTTGGMFADLHIKNPVDGMCGRFNTKKDAERDMKRIIELVGLKLHTSKLR